MVADEIGIPNLNRLRSYLRAEMNKALKDTDLKNNHVPVLTTVYSNPGLSITKLANTIGLDKSTVTRNIQQLTDLGYVDHRGDPCKVNEVYLTEKGMHYAEYLDDIQNKAYRRLMDDFTEGEVKELTRLTAKLAKTLTSLGF